MPRNPLPDYFDNLLSAARTVALTDIEAAPIQAKRLQQELARLNSQIDQARKSLAAERSEFDAWRRSSADETDLDQTRRELEQRDHEREVAALRAKAVAIQNQATAEHRKFDELVREYRKLEMKSMHPHAVPLG
jgi:peptidoglycan hydrolase CwlO-like protein